MSMLGALSINALTMQNNASSLRAISQNIANLTTTGYKRTDVNFKTLLSQTSTRTDGLGMARIALHRQYNLQGEIGATNRDMDIALNGRGFFGLYSEVENGMPLYTRSGNFYEQVNKSDREPIIDPATGKATRVDLSHIIDKNGYYLMGNPVDINGKVSTITEPIQVDFGAYAKMGKTTSRYELQVNLNSNMGVVTDHRTLVDQFRRGMDVKGSDHWTTTITLIDDQGIERNAQLLFSRTTGGTWNVSAIYDGGEKKKQIDTITLDEKNLIAGNEYVVSVNGIEVTHRVRKEDTMQDVADGLMARMKNNSTINDLTDIKIEGNTITLTAKRAGSGFTTATAGGTSIVTELSVNNDKGTEATKQQTLITLNKDNATKGTIYTINIKGRELSYTVSPSDRFVDIASNMAQKINAHSTISQFVTAEVQEGGKLLLTSKIAGKPFSTAIRGNSSVLRTVTARPAQQDTAQITNLAFNTNSLHQGGSYTLSINGTDLSRTFPPKTSRADAAQALADDVNAHKALDGIITASVEKDALVLRADTPGTPFVATIRDGSTLTTEKEASHAYTRHRLALDKTNLATGNSYTMNITTDDGNVITLTHTVSKGETIDVVRNSFKARIEGNRTLKDNVEVSFIGAKSYELILQPIKDTKPFTVSTGSNTTTTAEPIAAVAQEDSLDIKSTGVRVGASYTLVINNTPLDYIVQEGDTLADVRTALVKKASAHEKLQQVVEVSINRHDKIIIKAKETGVPFHTALGETIGGYLTNTQDNKSAAAAIAQKTEIKLSNTLPQAGDHYDFTLNGTTHRYTVSEADTQATDVIAAVADKIAATLNGKDGIKAGTSPTNKRIIIIEGNAEGTAFELQMTASNRGSVEETVANNTGTKPTAMVRAIALDESNLSPGNIYRFKIGSQTISHTVGKNDTMDDVRKGLLSAVNTRTGDTVKTSVNDDGHIILTHKTPGSTFEITTASGAGIENTAPNESGKIATDPIEIRFNEHGRLASIASHDLSLNFAKNDTAATGSVNFSLDLSNSTQYGAQSRVRLSKQNGFAPSIIESTSFSEEGYLRGHFKSGHQLDLYRIPFYTFNNPEGLEAVSGTAFRQAPDSGQPQLNFATSFSGTTFQPAALERSNVDLEDEFSKMLVIQQAYNHGSQAFRTIDEMLSTAQEMKA